MKTKIMMAALAAGGAMLFAVGSAWAVPPCTSKPALQRCNQFAYNSAECSQCKSCLSKGGKFVYKNSGPAKFRGLCKLSMKMEKMDRKLPVKPGPVGTSTPMPEKKY